jgi:uncharacterized protein YndB with AHSA1/START domain
VSDDRPLVKEIYIDANPELVFSFLSERDKMLRWMGLVVEIDPRPGGIYRVDPNGREVIRGKYLEVVRPRRIVFSWGWEVGGDVDIPASSTIVEIELSPRDGGTLLVLTHRNLPDDGDARRTHDFGWTHHLGRLKVVAEGGDPGPDPCWLPAPPDTPRDGRAVPAD